MGDECCARSAFVIRGRRELIGRRTAAQCVDLRLRNVHVVKRTNAFVVRIYVDRVQLICDSELEHCKYSPFAKYIYIRVYRQFVDQRSKILRVLLA